MDGADHDIPTSGVDRFGTSIHAAVAVVAERIVAAGTSAGANAH
jgi:hypothetical protein